MQNWIWKTLYAITKYFNKVIQINYWDMLHVGIDSTYVCLTRTQRQFADESQCTCARVEFFTILRNNVSTHISL